QLCFGLCRGPIGGDCDAPCPDGWSTPMGGQVDLCCRTDSNGLANCFFQSTGIGSDVGGGGDAGASGGRTGWSVADGNSYVMKCTFAGSTTCTCMVNGAVTKTLSKPELPEAGIAELDACDVSLCGFPPLP